MPYGPALRAIQRGKLEDSKSFPRSAWERISGRSASTEAAGAAAGMLPRRAWEQEVINALMRWYYIILLVMNELFVIFGAVSGLGL